ncbi:MAG: Hpt domain-containing protein [Robiginitomaculum sp.]|nr:Hpt domain-containing protein [Robiginitomaculum sp.]MCF6274451.1 Hpt domain-containing protein [Robiginitomaculum sp.]
MSDTEIDFEHIKQYLGDDIELTKEVFGLFKNQVEMWSRGMTPDADDESWGAIMHSLKGSARAIGAHKLAELCAKGEGLKGEKGGIEVRSAHIHDVKFSIEKALIEIGRWEYRQTLASMRS